MQICIREKNNYVPMKMWLGQKALKCFIRNAVAQKRFEC